MTKANPEVKYLEQRLKQRQTTCPGMQSLPEEMSREARTEHERQAHGPQAEPLRKLTRALISCNDMGAQLAILCDDQLREDAAEYWSQAVEYVQCVSQVMQYHPVVFDRIPFRGEHLKSRLERLSELTFALSRAQYLVTALSNTLTMERADAVRMADAAMMEVSAQLSRPTLDRQTRQSLCEVADAPLKVWQQRQEQAQRTQRRSDKVREQLKRQLQATEQEAGAERAGGTEHSLTAASAQAALGKKRRRKPGR